MVQKLQWLPAEIEAWFFSHNIVITNDFKQADYVNLNNSIHSLEYAKGIIELDKKHEKK